MRIGARLTARRVDLLLGIAATVAVGTGLASWAVGTGWGRWLTIAHAHRRLSLSGAWQPIAISWPMAGETMW